MPDIYKYRARDRTGKIIEGTVEAANSQAVSGQLRAQNLIVTKIEKASSNSLKKFNLSLAFGDPKVTTKELAIFSRQFATMIDAGVPLLRSLNILQAQVENKALQKALTAVVNDLQKGTTLSEAMNNQPKVFPVMYSNMIEAGEVGGVLEEVLERMANHFEKEDEIREKVKSALTYPAVVFSMAMLAVVFMLVFVLPSFVGIFDSMELELPTPTLFVMALSDNLRAYWYLFIGVIIAVIFVTKKILNNPKGKLLWDTYMLKMPVFGILQQKLLISRFSRTLSTLLRSGVPIIASLEVVRKTSSNQLMKNSIEEAKSSIREGKTLTEPLGKAGVFTPMSLHMMAVGEETGELDLLLEKISFFYDREVDVTVSKLSSALEPLIMVFMGIMIGGIVIAFMLPMVSMFDGI